jgi:hypothetical protein
MSEVMSSVEIEDVLSSIRRLVSEDLRPASRQASVSVVDEKLILTPALRVVAGQEASGVAPARPETAIAEGHRPLPRLHLGAEPATVELVASLQQAVEAQGWDWESETGDPMPAAVTFEWPAGVRAAAVADSDDMVSGTAETVDTTAESTAAFDTGLAGTEEVELATTVPDDQAETVATPSWAQIDPSEPVSDDSSIFHAEPSSLTPNSDPDWADQAEADVVAGLVEREPSAEKAAAAAEMTFDEEVLRDLVRDLIREELQGGLGERITRNVRKLVRAEIARALATREFD